MVRPILIIALLLIPLVALSADPKPARRQLPRNGVYTADIDYASGKVTIVRVLQSSGDRKLDASAVETFRNWRFKPKELRHVRIPVTFTLAGMKY